MKDLAIRLDVSTRTAYRYLELLQDIGFLFENNTDYVYKVVRSKTDSYLTISFTKQEVDLIIDRLPQESPLNKAIRDKLYIHSDILSLPNKILAADFGKNIRLLDKAIRDKKRVILQGYSSAHSNKKEDYRVEPIQLDDNYQRLYAFDLESRELRNFKTPRIEQTKVLEQDQWFSEKYSQDIKVDCFGWMIEDNTWDIELDMSRGAYHIIKEENPSIEKDTTEQPDDRFLLKTTVANLLPATSMILRLPGEIRVISPLELEAEAAKRLLRLDFFDKYFRALT